MSPLPGSDTSRLPAFPIHPTPTRRPGAFSAILVAGSVLLATAFAGSRAGVVVPFGQPADDSVTATGPDPGTTLEDHIEVQWSTEASIPVTSRFTIRRDGELIHVAAPSESVFEDWSTVPVQVYQYCVGVRDADGSESPIGCDSGSRVIARPTGFRAGDGQHEDYVPLSWSDRSQIEDGFNLYRDAGNALSLDGTNDYVETDGILDLTGSFTFEFWARRATEGTEDFVVNLEVNPNGDPVDVDMEIGFLQNDRFAVAFGNDVLDIPAGWSDTAWHHWAVAYDAPNHRRIIYRDGVRIADDVTPSDNRPTGDLEFGRRSKQGAAKNRGHFDGQLDEIRFWTVALTEEQVRTRMATILSLSEPGLAGYWPMDVASGAAVPDLAGELPGTTVDASPQAWTPSGVPEFRRTVGRNLTAWSDRSAVPGFEDYLYRIAAFQDVNEDGIFDAADDYESVAQVDPGWRGRLTPPDDVTATDGQFNDRVRITWVDRSATEEGYRIYRAGAQIGTADAGTETFDDLRPAGVHAYCVAAFGSGFESERTCDEGHAGTLAGPADVTATNGTLDDRVRVTWTDTGDTESGFDVYRDGTHIATLDADAVEYSDFGAAQGVGYTYCVEAFSTADPFNPSRSGQVCAPEQGVRAVILPPADLTASEDGFEDRVELAWENPSTTVMLFQVYRDGELIEVLDFTRSSTSDAEIPSDTDITYCVTGATVVVPGVTRMMQGQVAQVLEKIRLDNLVLESTGGEPVSPGAARDAVLSELGFAPKAGSSAADAFVESDPVCAVGRRSILAPTDLEATMDEDEDHVQLDWVDNSQVESGYVIYRATGGGEPETVDSLSANRTTFGDYRGVPGVTYTYSVIAYDAHGQSATDAAEGRRTLEPPTRFTADDGESETAVELAWQDNSTAERGYRVYRRPLGGDRFDVVGETGKNEPAFTDYPPDGVLGMPLEYRLVTFDAYGESVYTEDRGFTRVDAPGNLNASDLYDESVVVVWVDRSEVEDFYVLTRRPLGVTAPDVTEILPAGSSEFEDPSVQYGLRYEYCVRAVHDSNGSDVESMTVCDEGGLYAPDDGSGGGSDPVLRPTRLTGTSVQLPFWLSFIKPQYGASVSIADGIAVIGAPATAQNQWILGSTEGLGSAHQYTFDRFNRWTLRHRLESGDGFDFGRAVAIDSLYAVVGDPELTGSTGAFSLWSVASGNRQGPRVTGGANTGIAVALAEPFVLVGDSKHGPGTPSGHGGAIVCNKLANPSCAGAVRLESLFDDSLHAANAAFGTSVDLVRIRRENVDSLIAIVGAPGAGTERAYIFECDVLAGTACQGDDDWSLGEIVYNPFAGSNSQLGKAVATDGTIAVAGAPGVRGFIVLERTAPLTWEERDRVDDVDAAEFGSSAAIFESMLVIGAPGARVDEKNAAGEVYAFEWTGSDLALRPRYDARVAGSARTNARFGHSIDIGPEFILIGAPGEQDVGAVYSIPVGYEPPPEPEPIPEISIAPPSNVRASDGTTTDRIQIRWRDEADDEDGHLIYRSRDGGLMEKLDEVAANIEFYDDEAAAPGESYRYCIAAFSTATGELLETDSVCDIGWRPPDGAITGVLMSQGGGGTGDATICLTPSPNRSLLLDGFGGYVQAPVGDDLVLDTDFTVEGWVRLHEASGLRTVVARGDSYALELMDGALRFTAVESDGVKHYAPGATVPVGSWHHVAVTKDPSSNDFTFLLDGDFVGTMISQRLVSSEGSDSLTIGQYGDGTGFFSGEIDDVRIWNRARSAAEIQSAMYRPLRGDEENLVGNWPLDDGVRRIAPDVSGSANHGSLEGGVYLADDGAPIDRCVRSEEDGNFSMRQIRYGEAAEYRVTPTKAKRRFEPSFQIISLSTESPVQNQVIFSDVTTHVVAGTIRYEDVIDSDTLSCPSADVGIHVSKDDVAVDENLRTTTRADGSFSVGVDPSEDVTDPWYVMPRVTGGSGGDTAHTFSPDAIELVLQEDTYGLEFRDELRHTLSGFVSGGDPEDCGRDIGLVELRIRTQDGCYDRTLEVDSGIDHGAFSLELPPLAYLVDVRPVGGAPEELADEIADFFERLGSVEVDLTAGDVERNFEYHAPIVLEVAGLAPPQCPGNRIVQRDEDGGVLRVLPAVASIREYESVPLTIRVHEDYGDGVVCPVSQGEVEIFDAIADRVDADSTIQLDEGVAEYETYGASPNIYSGARIGGVDRSFQKPITVVAHVEGRDPLMVTEWAIVEGYRERGATFTSATTEEFPLLIIHDPPGSNSYAFLEEGLSHCTTISNRQTFEWGAGGDLEWKFGFKTGIVVAPMGGGQTIETGAGFTIGAEYMHGEATTDLADGDNTNICVRTTENFRTSADPVWVGEDIHVGVALNLIFAIADVLAFESSSCSVELSETLAGDLNRADPFESTYVYGSGHIERTLVPELEHLIELAGGDPSITGELAGEQTTIRLQHALENWREQLENSAALQREALQRPLVNRSFSGGTEFSYTEVADTTTTLSFESVRVYNTVDAHLGVDFTFGWSWHIYGRGKLSWESVSETEETETKTRSIGYVLADNNPGDYFSVDVGKDPRYGTFVFGTRSGRSSGPWEPNTQRRDNPIVMVDPPVMYNVDPDEAARFQLTLINGSESMERRSYQIDVPGETNPFNLGVTVTGDLLGGNRLETFLLDPGKALTVNMDVFAAPSAFSYPRVGVMMYPEAAMALWAADPRQPFAVSDTAFFSVYFDSTGGNALASVMQEGWNWFSTNRPTRPVSEMLEHYPARHGDVIRGRRAEARYDSTLGWTGSLAEVIPGEGYRVRVAQPGLIRIRGDAVEPAEPLSLEPGWNWLGYLPTKRLPVGDALASLTDRLIDGDAVVGQDGFARFVSGVGWIGTLDDMVPGEAYDLYLGGGGDLLYPAATERSEPRAPAVRETTALGPDWTVDPGAWDASMTMVVEVTSDGVPLPYTTLRLAVTDGDSVRGVADVRYVEALERYLAFVQVYGPDDSVDDLRVHVYDGESDRLFEDVARVRFAARTLPGDPTSPLRLDLANAGMAPELLDLPAEFALHPNFPNPFNPVTVIGYDLPRPERVSIAVYDVLGRLVTRLVDGDLPAGRHQAVFDARAYASGLYLYRMKAGTFTQVGKMILVK